jgi:membrane peptidoglycan carboxypeptidase
MIWVTCLTGFVLLAAAVSYLWFTTPIPKVNDVAISQSTTVLFSDGSTLGTIGATNRESVKLSQVPLSVQRAVLAAEDRKFYSEPGISLPGIARAVLVDLSGGHVQGGSTITQQYAKNAYLTQKRSLSRKLREVVIAEKLDQTRSKNQILEDYLNTIYFGRGASGIQKAAKVYFNKDVSKLTTAEGAVLAAVINRPSYLDPLVHPAAAKARYDYVMLGMVKEKWLPAALPYPKTVIKYTPQRVTGPNAFIMDYVQKELSSISGFDEQQLASGVTIVTTIDRNAQAAAIQAEDDKLNNVVKSVKSDDPPVGALVAMQPSDGAIRALYGGQGSTANGSCSARKGGCLDLATQGLFQPGSSFKPYVLAQAIESKTAGILDTRNGPAVLPDPPGPDVHNDSGEVCNNCTLSKALAMSVNTIYVPLAKQLDPKHVKDMANRLGVPEQLDDNGVTSDRIALGVYPVHPIDQAVGFGTLCNGGVSVKPFLVRSVKNNKGDNIYTFGPKGVRRVQTEVANDVTTAMQQVVSSPVGTGKAASLGDRPVAGKTGTTQNNTNAWFIGCTGPAKNNGQLVTAVWVGHAAAVTPLTDIPGFEKGVFGGQIPAQIFQQFMSKAMEGKKVVQFPAPAYYTGPKPASTATVAPTTSTPSPTPTKSTASPKPTKTRTTTVPPVTTTAVPPPTSAAPPPTSAAATTTSAAPPPATSAAVAGPGAPSAAPK